MRLNESFGAVSGDCFSIWVAGGGKQNKREGEKDPIFKKDFRFPDTLVEAKVLPWPGLPTKTQGMIAISNREIHPFPEKGLWAEPWQTILKTFGLEISEAWKNRVEMSLMEAFEQTPEL